MKNQAGILLAVAGMVLSVQLLPAQNLPSDVGKAFSLLKKNTSRLLLTDDDLNNAAISSTYTSPDGITMVYLQQTYQGIPVYNQVQSIAFKNENMVSASGSRIGKMPLKANTPQAQASILPADALQRAAVHLRLSPPSGLVPLANSSTTFLQFPAAAISQQAITVQQLWLPVSENEVKLIWQVAISPLHSADNWLVQVDALTGEVLAKNNLTVNCNWSKPAPQTAACAEEPLLLMREDDTGNRISNVDSASYRVIPFPAESPNHPGGAPAIRTNPWTAAPGNATTLNWQYDGIFEYRFTKGNNVYAHEDVDGYNVTNGAADTSSTPLPALNFVQTPDFTQAPGTTNNQRFAITNLFYWNNVMHDIAYLYGFNEAAGNFQASNLDRGGNENDYVIADAQDGSGTNNANFYTPSDGGSPRMQLYLFDGNPARDASLDNGIIAHEYTHGISNRFTGGPLMSSCLLNAEQMGEGWSDYFGLMLTTNWATATVNDGSLNRPIGTYVFGQPVSGGGIRTYPYTTNMNVDPWTYDMLALYTGGEVHLVGEIWCSMLWDMTWNIIGMDNINPSLYNPGATGGNSAALKLVIEGMRLQPCSPGFVDGRDAILRADTILFNGRYSCAIWAAFARRGLGSNASQGLSTRYSDGTAGYASPFNARYTFEPDRQQAAQNEEIVYTASVIGGACAPVLSHAITDTLPPNVTYISGGTYNAGSRIVSFVPVNVATGTIQTYTYTARVNSGAYTPTVTFINETLAGSTVPATWATTTNVATNWGVSGSQSLSAPFAFFTSDSSLLADKMLITANPVLVGGYTSLSFWHNYSLESGFDGGVVEITTNNGGTWTDLGNYITQNGYNGVITPLSYGSPIQGRPAFTASSGGFVHTIIDLSSFAGEQVKIRFRLGSDNQGTGIGWFIDDILLKKDPAVISRSNLLNSNNQLMLSALAVTTINSTILPVVWGNFSVQKQNSAALLLWTTLQEVNTGWFVVERSTDGRNFSPLAMVKAAGNSNSTSSYTYRDALPLKGTNYYRILQKDKDGKGTYTVIRSLSFDNSGGDITLTPNPAKDLVAITMPGNTATYTAKMLNSAGQTVFTFTIVGQYSQVKLPQLPSGAYYLKIENNNNTVVKKLMIQ